MNRRLITLWTATLIIVSSFSAASGTLSATTVGPEVVGWWSASRPNAAVPAVTPPDVGAKDLYVAGANALPGQLAGPTGAGPAAIAALRFRLPAGSSVQELRLELAGTRPPAVTMTACRATEPFAAVYGGAWTDAPSYDCTGAGTARLEPDGQVVLDGVDGLQQGQELAVVLVPGPLDRVVVAAPDASTLTVSSSSAVGSGVGAGPPPPGAPMSPAAPPGGSGAGASGLAPTLSDTPGGAGLVAAPSDAAAPVVADPAVPGPQPANAAVELPARPWATLLATALIALLAFVAMINPRGALGGAGPVGAPGAAGVRGVGRFRSERKGVVPDLT